MAKKAWISLPLITSCDASDASVVTFLKGGLKKDLEVETAAFVQKWLMDRDIPFGVDFASASVDRALVIESLPKRLQKILGATVPVASDAIDVPQVEEAAQVVEAGATEPVTVKEEAAQVDEAADEAVAEVHEAGAAELIAEVADVGADLPAGDGGADKSLEL
jgi:hypothetical protein